MASIDPRAEEVLGFWFSGSDRDPRWFAKDFAFDAQVRERFLPLHEQGASGALAHWLEAPRGSLALVILLDQFPRNMFRGHAEQFATDQLALQIAHGAVDRDFDGALQPDERAFLYMPFQHSERIEDQKRSLLLFNRLGDERFLPFARKHHDVIARFGRFPHRNAMLGRAPRPDEIAAGDVFPW